MKLTKALLRKIIQEETIKELNPRDGYNPNPGQLDEPMPEVSDEGVALEKLYTRVAKITSDFVAGRNELMRSEYKSMAKELISIRDYIKEMTK